MLSKCFIMIILYFLNYFFYRLSFLDHYCAVIFFSLHRLSKALSELTAWYSVFLPCCRFTLYAVDTRGRHSELSTVTLRTACPLVDDNKAEGRWPISSFPR